MIIVKGVIVALLIYIFKYNRNRTLLSANSSIEGWSVDKKSDCVGSTVGLLVFCFIKKIFLSTNFDRMRKNFVVLLRCREIFVFSNFFAFGKNLWGQALAE